MRTRLESYDGLYSANLLEAELRAAFAREHVVWQQDLVSAIGWVLPARRLTDEIARVLAAGYLRAIRWGILATLGFTALRGLCEGISHPRPVLLATVGAALANATLELGHAHPSGWNWHGHVGREWMRFAQDGRSFRGGPARLSQAADPARNWRAVHADRVDSAGIGIGYAMADHMRTDLVIAALDMAARNYPLAEEAVFHTDRGTQYTSAAFAEHTAMLGIRRSVGRTGVCFDNAAAESFNAAVKVERVNRTVYPTREHARRDVARYIEFRYNTRRLHSALGYRTPREAHNDYINSHGAA